MALPLTRRKFIQKSSGVIALAALPYHFGRSQNVFEDTLGTVPASGSPELKALVNAGLDAARNAGATYADIVYQFTRKEDWIFWDGTVYPVPSETFTVATGVRALYNGYWGFAGLDGLVTGQDMAKLGRDSVTQAKNGGLGKPRSVEMAQAPVVKDGNWVMPVEIDPFTQVTRDEKIDFITAMSDYYARERVGVGTTAIPSFRKEERAFASTEGVFVTQTLYTSSCLFSVGIEPHFVSERPGSRGADFITPAGAGWEYIRRAPFQDRAAQMVEHAARVRHGKPVDVGRYEVVFDASAIARILDSTVGQATELDRAFGYEANSVGTSFINEPLEMLDTFKLGNSMVSISANRSMNGGAATVKWDDEGVEPQNTTLVKDGVLVGFQTTRESASWLKRYYTAQGRPVNSTGNAARERASFPTAQRSSNLVMTPGNHNTTFEDMVAGTKRGYAVLGGSAYTDQQALNGNGRGGVVYEIRDGKLGDVVKDSSYLYRAPEFWHNIVAIGGLGTVQSFGIARGRGASRDWPVHTVSAVPAKVSQVAIIDAMRKA